MLPARPCKGMWVAQAQLHAQRSCSLLTSQPPSEGRNTTRIILVHHGVAYLPRSPLCPGLGGSNASSAKERRSTPPQHSLPRCWPGRHSSRGPDVLRLLNAVLCSVRQAHSPKSPGELAWAGWAWGSQAGGRLSRFGAETEWQISRSGVDSFVPCPMLKMTHGERWM